MSSLSKVSQTRKRTRGCEFSERTEIVEVVHTIPRGGTYSETTDSGTDIPQVAGADHPGFSKTTQHAANTNVQQVVNAVEVKTLKIIKKSMLGEKVDPDDDKSTNDQSGDQTGRDSSASALSRSRSSECRRSQQVSSTQGPAEDCKDNASQDPFSRCEICQTLGYRLS